MEKEQNFRKALNFIEENLDTNVSLCNIAQIAGYSVPQFYRLFKKLTGDSIGEYLIRRKMSMAAVDLKESKQSIADIAFKYGFESHDVFTRSFRRVYGVTPNEFRRNNSPFTPLKRLALKGDCAGSNEEQMTFQVRNLESFCVVGMECNATTWDTDGEISHLWERFLERIHEIKHTASPLTMYGICEYELCCNGHFVYMAAVGVQNPEDIPSGMVKRTIRAQKFFEANVPEQISTPDAYTGSVDYAKSLAFHIEDYDDLEVYENTFQDPDYHRYKLLIPIE